MRKDLKEFLEKIRNSDDKTKKHWVIGASILSMAIVLAFWFFYSTSLIKPVDQSVLVDQNNTNDFWPVMKNGLGVIYRTVKDGFGNFTAQMSGERSITIEKQN